MPRFLDRSGTPLSYTFLNRLNLHHTVHSSEIPSFLIQAVIRAEDKRFYLHRGVDPIAIVHAFMTNLRALRIVRGGSTISEQVARIITPRRRGVWGRWMSALEALRLEWHFGKQEILEFYLNQAPFPAQRRGIVEGARYLFSRNISTLSRKEMCAMAVSLRAPSLLDITTARGLPRVSTRVDRLVSQLKGDGILSTGDEEFIRGQLLSPRLGAPLVDASNFLRHLKNTRSFPTPSVVTTIDGVLQDFVTKILTRRVQSLRSRGVTDGGALVVDNVSGDVLAWSCAGGDGCSGIDPVTALRQPGSTLKPFLYATALEKGWHAATIVDDAPLALPAGTGLKDFRNFSNRYHGPVTVRTALANSLNIPAVLALRSVGGSEFLRQLHQLGFHSLGEHSQHYGEGLALGNGEVSLLELVTAYRSFATRGVLSPFRMVEGDKGFRRSVYRPEVASIILDILSDSEARSLEFEGDLLSLPHMTAIKTGTSTDFKDAWIIGVSSRYTVGVWMGDLFRSSMREITGSEGPGMVLRAVFAYLERDGKGRPLPREGVEVKRVCTLSGGLARESCPSRDEVFTSHASPHHYCAGHSDPSMRGVASSSAESPRITLPTPGLQLALDPRIPQDLQEFPFVVETPTPVKSVLWIIDGKELRGEGRRLLWRVSKGDHSLRAIVESIDGQEAGTSEIRFSVR